MINCYAKFCNALDCLRSPFLLLVRLYWGYGFFVAGKGKLMNLERTAGFFADLQIPLPKLNAIMAGSIECFGGTLLILGLFSRLVSIPLVIVMVVAYLTAHHDIVIAFFGNTDAFFKADPFLYMFATLIVLVFGPGCYSLDAWLKRRCCKDSTCASSR